MELTGKLIQKLPLQSGESRNGAWKKQEFIFELEGTYPRKVCVDFWNEKINSNLSEGSMLKVSFDIESREYNGKWYTNLKGWKIEELASDNRTETEYYPDDVPPIGQEFAPVEDDLPF